MFAAGKSGLVVAALPSVNRLGESIEFHDISLLMVGKYEWSDLFGVLLEDRVAGEWIVASR